MRNWAFFILIFLMSCGGSKEGINEKDMNEFIANSDESAINKETEKSNKDDNAQVSESTSETDISESMTVPVFKFSTLPDKNYDLTNDNDLLLTIVGKGNADISLSWQDNSGNWKTVKNGFKNEDIYTLKYSAEFVKRNIGLGEKRFVAEVLFNKDREPVMLETSLNIIRSETEPVKDVGFNKDNVDKKIDIEVESSTVFDDIYFDYKKWKIPSFKYNTNFSLTLNKAVKALKVNPAVNLILTGYTDEVGSFAYNRILAKKRCYSVSQLILKNFEDSEKSNIEKRIFIDPAGEKDPIFKDATNSQAKRRVSLSLSYNKRGISLSQFDIDNVETVSSSSPVSKSGSSKYKRAMKAFYAKNFDEALRGFTTVCESTPTSSVADNAKWWIGEIYYIRKDYSKALANYKQVFGMGDGNKEAYAQYRIGCCYREMGDREAALKALENVKIMYPDATEEWQKSERIIKNISY